MTRSVDHVDDAFRAATEHHQAGRTDQAQAAYRRVLELRPDHVDALHLLGVLLSGSRGLHDDAAELIARAIALQPRNAVFHNNLGEVRRYQQRHGDAIAAYRQAITLQPQFAEAHFNLGNVLKTTGDHAGAIDAYRRAVALRPRYAKALFNLANTLREYGLVKAAVEAYREALSVRPDWADAHLNLGNAHMELAEAEPAIASYERAMQLDAGISGVESSLSNAYASQGRIEHATQWSRREVAREPRKWLRALRAETLAEPIPQSVAYIDDYRARLVETLDRFIEQAHPADVADLHASGAEPPMLLAYHGRDDRPIKERYAQLFAATLPRRDPPPWPRGKPHVGVVVTHGHEGVFFKCLGGIVDRLPSADLRVTLCCSRSGENVLRQWMRNAELEYLVLPEPLYEAAQRITHAGIHLLHYWEVGTDSTNYFLPFFRAAPLQSATWGWPVTSGCPAIDWYVSAEPLEPAQAECHYSEKLVRLASLPTFYRRPPVPEQLKGRDHFGIGAAEHVYLCMQNLRKYQPDFDDLLASILCRDSQGRLFLIEDVQRSITQKLMDRLKTSMPDAIDRVRVMPRLAEAEYLNLLALADVALDTTHYGGGANTVYDAVAVGTPMVTLRGHDHRVRWCGAVNERLGVTEAVADTPQQFVDAATGVACDPDRRRAISARFTAGAKESRLFEDLAAVDELRRFFPNRIGEAR